MIKIVVLGIHAKIQHVQILPTITKTYGNGLDLR